MASVIRAPDSLFFKIKEALSNVKASDSLGRENEIFLPRLYGKGICQVTRCIEVTSAVFLAASDTTCPGYRTQFLLWMGWKFT